MFLLPALAAPMKFVQVKKIAIKLGTGCVQGSNVNDIATSVTFALRSLKKEEQYFPYIFFPRNCKT